MRFVTSKIIIADATNPVAPMPQHPPDFMNVLNDIKGQGGKPLMVGGFVRDQFFGKQPKDRDVEVYNMHPEQLEKTLSNHGTVNAVGKSFGVLKMRTPNGPEDYDFSTPRRDSKVGEGHKGFVADLDPGMSEPEAFGRRDFTMNAIGQDPFTGQYIDHYGGIQHIKDKKLVATTDAYKEDPLRVLRGAQMAARFGLDMDDRTAQMSKDIHHTYPSLDKSRVWEEWQKLAQKGEVPSKGLKVLEDTGWISHMPHLDNDPKRAQAVDTIAKLTKGTTGDTKSSLFYATLLHDKPPEQVHEFLKEIGASNDISNMTMKMAAQANAPLDANPATLRNLAHKLNGVPLDDFLKMKVAMHPEETQNIANIRQIAQHLGILKSAPKPFLNGNDLMGAGYKQGPEMGKKLKELFQAQLDGKINNKQEALNALMAG